MPWQSGNWKSKGLPLGKGASFHSTTGYFEKQRPTNSNFWLLILNFLPQKQAKKGAPGLNSAKFSFKIFFVEVTSDSKMNLPYGSRRRKQEEGCLGG